jgi:hypothetical protein
MNTEKWVTCKSCGADFKVSGYKAGQQTVYTDAINCHQLQNKLNGVVYLYPTICISCADIASAKSKPKQRSPHNDP